MPPYRLSPVIADHLVIYTLIHQPRRIRIPAAPIPKRASVETLEQTLFDDELNRAYLEKVARRSYRPAIQIWRELLTKGMKLGLGIPLSTIFQFEAWDPQLLATLKTLVGHDRCELVATEPYHAISMLLDLQLFSKGMQRSVYDLQRHFGKTPRVADTTELMMSPSIAQILAGTGFDGGFVDGRSWVLHEESAPLYSERGRLPLLARHLQLSDDVAYRFSDRMWPNWPLTAEHFADRVSSAPNELVTLGWDFETFGEHHDAETGILDFLRALPSALDSRGIICLTPSEAITHFRPKACDLRLSAFPSTWAGHHGGLDFFLGNDSQHVLFGLMMSAYGAAKLSEDENVIDIAHLLMQSDNLHWLQWIGQEGSDAEVSEYFTPMEWKSLGTDTFTNHHRQVYVNFINAIS